MNDRTPQPDGPEQGPGPARTDGDPATTPTSDRALVDRFSRRRDELAFRALYRRHTPFLYALACRTANGPGPEADELVQDTWIRAVERLDRFEWRSQLRTWLAGILFNCHRERLKRRRTRETEAVPDEVAGPAGVRPDVLDLEHALGSLADGYRQVVLLHYVYGYKHEEVAELLGISTGTSKSQASRGIQRLRTLMGRG